MTEEEDEKKLIVMFEITLQGTRGRCGWEPLKSRQQYIIQAVCNNSQTRDKGTFYSRSSPGGQWGQREIGIPCKRTDPPPQRVAGTTMENEEQQCHGILRRKSFHFVFLRIIIIKNCLERISRLLCSSAHPNGSPRKNQ